jgi:hypothetical protein
VKWAVKKMLEQPSNQKPKTRKPRETVRLFILRVQPAQFDLAWCATLEDEHQPQLEFSSPLKLGRFLADLKPISPNPAHSSTTGLR